MVVVEYIVHAPGNRAAIKEQAREGMYGLP